MCAARAVNILKARREKLVDWELDLFKQLARIIRRRYALLIRNTEVIDRHHHLNVALQLYDGEQADADADNFGGAHAVKFVVKQLGNNRRARKLYFLPAVRNVAYAARQTNRIDNR